MKSGSASTWTRVVARWVKRPSPLSLEITSQGRVHRTVGTAEMQDAAHAFYTTLYNNGETIQLPSRRDVQADIWPSYLTFDNFHDTLTQVVMVPMLRTISFFPLMV